MKSVQAAESAEQARVAALISSQRAVKPEFFPKMNDLGGGYGNYSKKEVEVQPETKNYGFGFDPSSLPAQTSVPKRLNSVTYQPPSSDSAASRFSAQKSISSDQYFNRNGFDANEA